MTDIVERLRGGVYGIDRIPLCAEAANEIERLRAEVAALRRGEFICMRCALRKDSEHDAPVDF